jgi:anaerobic sulfite reductase subunit C
MKWNKEAEEAVSKVPFFVRRRVKKRVEEEATRLRADIVTLEHVAACKRKYLENMEDEVKGYQLETCFGPSGCPNRAVVDERLAAELEKMLAGKNLRDFLKARVSGPLKMHHEFRVSMSDCPNACSRPQIVDVGIIGAVRPRISENFCTGCGACVAVCKERAIEIDPSTNVARIDLEKCLYCGQCMKVCPAGALTVDVQGYRVLLGGKLGRHPILGTELDGIYSREQVIEIMDKCLSHHMAHSSNGERFGEVLGKTGLNFLNNGEGNPQKIKKNENS